MLFFRVTAKNRHPGPAVPLIAALFPDAKGSGKCKTLMNAQYSGQSKPCSDFWNTFYSLNRLDSISKFAVHKTPPPSIYKKIFNIQLCAITILKHEYLFSIKLPFLWKSVLSSVKYWHLLNDLQKFIISRCMNWLWCQHRLLTVTVRLSRCWVVKLWISYHLCNGLQTALITTRWTMQSGASCRRSSTARKFVTSTTSLSDSCRNAPDLTTRSPYIT